MVTGQFRPDSYNGDWASWKGNWQHINDCTVLASLQRFEADGSQSFAGFGYLNKLSFPLPTNSSQDKFKLLLDIGKNIFQVFATSWCNILPSKKRPKKLQLGQYYCLVNYFWYMQKFNRFFFLFPEPVSHFPSKY